MENFVLGLFFFQFSKPGYKQVDMKYHVAVNLFKKLCNVQKIVLCCVNT